MNKTPRKRNSAPSRGRRSSATPQAKRSTATPQAKRSTAPRKKKSAPGRSRTSNRLYRIVEVDKAPGKDLQGKEYRRFFQIETLARAIERAMEQEATELKRIWTEVRGTESPKLRLELLRETSYTLTYRFTASAGSTKRVAVTFVAAKNAQECAKKAEAEYELLKSLAARAPKLVLAPFESGTLFLPDRHRRKSQHRELFFYLAEDLPGFHPISDSRGHQLVLQSTPHHRMSIEETEQFKARFTELVAASFDIKTRTTVSISRIEPTDLLARRGGGSARLKLCGCRWMLTRATPPRILDALQDADWNWGMGPFHPIPRDPEDFIASLEKALGKATAREWIHEYVRRVRAGSYPGRNPDHFAALEEYVA